MIRLIGKKNDFLIAHCCTEKTASQWFIKFLQDDIITKRCKLVPKNHSLIFNNLISKAKANNDFYSFSRSLYAGPYPEVKLKKGTINTSLYVSLPMMRKMIPKNTSYKSFFILRDPRDLMISVYFSMKNSHPVIDSTVQDTRIKLQNSNFEEGMKYCIDTTVEKSMLFLGQQSWLENELNETEQVFRFEDFTNNYIGFVNNLIDFLDLDLPFGERNKLINKYDFKNFSDGRSKGENNTNSHYRSGKAEQWREHFTPFLEEYFKKRTGKLVETLGYNWDLK